jgi:hypothetical protein
MTPRPGLTGDSVGDDRRRLADRRIHPVDTLTFKSITAYRSGDTHTVIDFDETPLPTLDIPAIYSDDQFSQEFQLLYTGERLSGVAGLFYLDATASGAFDTIAGNLGLSIAAAGFDRHQILFGLRRLQLRPVGSPAHLGRRPLHP